MTARRRRPRWPVAVLAVTIGTAAATTLVSINGVAGAATATTITVFAGGGGNDLGTVPDTLLGVNHRYTFDGYGTFDPATGQMRPDVVTKTRNMGVAMVRWPGGTVANTTRWKQTIGTDRACQRDGRVTDLGAPGNPADDVLAARSASYGLDEHMAFVDSIGAQAQILVPAAVATALDAADLVEYLNTAADDGVNPNGGTDWAQVRKANGHAAPYGVSLFEVGNEPYLSGQRYWAAQDDPAADPPERPAIDDYINGAARRITGEKLGKLTVVTADGTRACTGSTAPVPSDGTPGQVFSINYPTVVKDSVTVTVGGTAWRQVDDLSTAGPAATVYQLRPAAGEVVFGDGVHGAIPAAGARVVADYTSTHPGFVKIYERMKQVDPSISVCASWGRASFAQLFPALAPAGSSYDCLTMHPYTNFTAKGAADWDSPLEAHDWQMVSVQDSVDRVVALRKAVDANTPAPHPYVALSEYGALWGPDENNPFPEYNRAMTHVLYMASQWIDWLELGIGWAEGNDFASDGWYTLLGPDSSGFIVSGEGMARRAVKPMFEAGGARVRHEVAGNPVRDPADATMCDGGAPADACRATYDKLEATATRGADGHVYVMVVNRSPFATDSLDATLNVNGIGTADAPMSVRRVAPDGFQAHNDVQTPDAITMRTSQRTVDPHEFTVTFPPFSVTLLDLG